MSCLSLSITWRTSALARAQTGKSGQTRFRLPFDADPKVNLRTGEAPPPLLTPLPVGFRLCHFWKCLIRICRKRQFPKSAVRTGKVGTAVPDVRKLTSSTGTFSGRAGRAAGSRPAGVRTKKTSTASAARGGRGVSRFSVRGRFRGLFSVLAEVATAARSSKDLHKTRTAHPQ